MKIILTAFGGKLQSHVMEWPENTAPRVELIMDMGQLSPMEARSVEKVATKSNHKRGTFEWTGNSSWGNDKDDKSYEIKEYKLIDIS